MSLSQASLALMIRIADSGGSIECEGNNKSGKALKRKKLVIEKRSRYFLTAAGRKLIEKL